MIVTRDIRESGAYPEIHSLRLSHAATYSDPWASSLGTMLKIDELRFQPWKWKEKKDALVVNIIFDHLVPEIFQPGTSVDLFPDRLDVIDLAFERRADERRRRVVSVDSGSGC